MNKLLIALILFFSNHSMAKVLSGCYEIWEPFIYKKDNKLTGIVYDIVEKALGNLGHRIQWTEMPPKRCYVEIEKKRMNLAVGISRQGDRKWIHSQTIVNNWELAALVHPSFKGDKFTSFERLKGKKFGKTSGYVYPEDIENFLKTQKVGEVTEAISNLKMLSENRIDVIFEDPIWAAIKSKELGLKVKTLSPNVAVDPNYSVFSSDLAEVVMAYDLEIQKMANSGDIDKVYDSYLGQQNLLVSDFRQ